jgi:type VI secretion system protein ImpK
MHRQNVGWPWTVVLALVALGLLVGCAASKRTNSRLDVITAENIDLNQQRDLAQRQAREAQLAHDRAIVGFQEQKHEALRLADELAGVQQDAVLGQQALAELERSREDNQRNAERLEAMVAEVDRLKRLAKPRPVAPPPEPGPSWEPSPHLDAFAADVRAKLASAGISLPVEMRTTRDGTRRVAIVLKNAFPAGKDSLSYNMAAVRAVVGLGQLVASSYPTSRVLVEGHTDSDPIRKSPFASNEALSLSRAESVRGLLVKAGVRSDLVETAGHGARNPVASGSTARAKAENRRVEIYIQPGT